MKIVRITTGGDGKYRIVEVDNSNNVWKVGNSEESLREYIKENKDIITEVEK